MRPRRRLLVVRAAVVGALLAVCGCAGRPPGTTLPEASVTTSASPSSSPTPAAPTPVPVTCGSVPAPDATFGAEPTDPLAQPAVPALLGLFDEAPIVAIGEIHGWPALHDALGQLICDPRFPDVVDAIVVEFGTSRLQDVLDRYVLRGEDVSRAELQTVWRDSTQRSGVWEHPIYERFFILVRSVNLGLPPEARIRVLAGDPPIDWAAVTSFTSCSSEDPSCLDYWIFRRDESFARIVLDEVLARGGRALLVAGAGHMLPGGGPPRPLSLPELIEAESPNVVHVVIPHTRLGDPAEEPERTIRAWPIPSLAVLRDSWLGALSACLVDACEGEADGRTIADLADAYLYVGPR